MSPASPPPAGRPGERAPARSAAVKRLLAWIAAALAIAAAAGAVLFARRAAEYRAVQGDLDRAAAACRAAREAGARALAPDTWLLATTGMDEAMAELHRQDGRFVLLRDYPRVHALLADATDAAEAARATADAARKADEEEARSAMPGGGHPAWGGIVAGMAKPDAQAAVDAAKAALASTLALFNRVENCPRARRAREVRKDLEVVRGNLEAMRRQAEELDVRLSRGDVSGAKAAADTLRGALAPLEMDLEGIVNHFKCRMP